MLMGRRGTLLSIVGVLAASSLLLSAAAARPPKSPASALRVEATKLFKAKKFAAACPKFKAALDFSPNDPELMLDLAVCDFRIKETDAARALNEKVIALESAPARLLDAKAARNRRHAYYNLADLDGNIDTIGQGDNGEVKCQTLEPQAGCKKAFFSCAIHREDGWQARLLTRTVVRVATTKEAAMLKVTDGERDPSFDVLGAKPEPLPTRIKKGESVTYLGEWVEEARGDWEGSNGTYGCKLVNSDACTGLLGIVCAGYEDKPGPWKTSVEEYLLE
jgi:hypothetical protein